MLVLQTTILIENYKKYALLCSAENFTLDHFVLHIHVSRDKIS